MNKSIYLPLCPGVDEEPVLCPALLDTHTRVRPLHPPVLYVCHIKVRIIIHDPKLGKPQKKPFLMAAPLRLGLPLRKEELF